MKRKRTCCLRIRSIEQFYKLSKRKDGIDNECSICRNIRNTFYYLFYPEKEKTRKQIFYNKNKIKILGRNKDWKDNNKEKAKGIIRKWQQTNKDKVKNAALKHKFGITLEDFTNMLTKQNYLCSIGKEKLTVRTANVDHCHKTGKVRGLLCSTCNSGIGMLKDSIPHLKSAITYLKRNRG